MCAHALSCVRQLFWDSCWSNRAVRPSLSIVPFQTTGLTFDPRIGFLLCLPIPDFIPFFLSLSLFSSPTLYLSLSQGRSWIYRGSGQNKKGPYVHMNHETLLGIREQKHMDDVVATVTHDFSKQMLRWKRMLQAYVSSVSDISEACWLFYMDVAKVDQWCYIYCKCFRGML
jgi:hypothetical protein